GEGRRQGAADRHDLDRPLLDAGEDLLEAAKIEDVLEGLAAGLARDREVGVAPHHLLEIGGALAGQPEGGAAPANAGGEDQGALSGLAVEPAVEGGGLDLGGHPGCGVGGPEPPAGPEELL